METSLHRQLKLAYALSAAHTEVNFAAFRIDAIGRANELVEIQHASLGALKTKIRRLLDHDSQYSVRVVKPIVARKWIVTRQSPTGPVLRKRLSPKRGELCDIFLDLVHFTALFPHPRLTLEVLLVNTEEQRVAKLKHRFRRKNYVTLEQTLVSIEHRFELHSASDLWRVLPEVKLPASFDTAELARQIQRPRWFAQKVAYCLRNCDAITLTGKSGNSQLYTTIKIKPKRTRKPQPQSLAQLQTSLHNDLVPALTLTSAPTSVSKTKAKPDSKPKSKPKSKSKTAPTRRIA